jgi:hypothetical protein
MSLMPQRKMNSTDSAYADPIPKMLADRFKRMRQRQSLR